MSEAGELAHWEILATLNQTAKDPDIAGLVTRGVPLERRHVKAIREHALRLAGNADPLEPA